MLELMGPDQKDDRERIEEMIMSASRKLRDRSKVHAKMASKQSRPFKAGALNFAKVSLATHLHTEYRLKYRLKFRLK